MIDLGYAPQARQAMLHSTSARWALYGGAAGGGKSHSLRMDMLGCAIHNPRMDGYLFRRTSPQLEKNHVQHFRRMPLELGTYNQTRKRFELANHSGINMCHCEHEDDVENYQGPEIHYLGVDEAQQFTPYQLTYLVGRVRLGSYKPKEPAALKRIVFTANPGGPAHAFLKEVFIDPAAPETLFFDPETQMVCIFIPAKMTDNQYLEEGYAAQFSRLPTHLQKMLVDGDWNVVPGAFFDCWDTLRNKIAPFRLPAHWVRMRSIDWGHATPFSVGWWAIATEDYEIPNAPPAQLTRYIPRGALVRYREWYGAALQNGRPTRKGLRMSGAKVGEGIVLRTGDERIRYTVCDPSAWSRHSGPSPAEGLIESGIPLIPADNSREAGWQEMYTRIKGDGDVPMAYIFDDCRQFERTVPMQQADDNHPEDIKKNPEDHVADESRYLFMSRPIAGEIPEPEEVAYRRPTFDELRNSVRRQRLADA